jgi:tripartite-type tricarboxylate transporter receptor subunit TctC
MMSRDVISRRGLVKFAGAIGLSAPPFLRATAALAAFPNKAIRIIVPASPGGAADITARLLTGGMQEILGVPVVIDNKPGGGTNIGLGATARADADGYTIGLSTSAFVINPGLYERLPFDPLKDFAGVCEFSSAPGVLVVKPDLGVNTIREFVDLAKRDPKKFNISTPGVGTPPQLQAEVLKQREGLKDMATIVFGGGGDAVTALLSNTVQICSGVLATVHDHVTSGTLKVLGVSGKQRWHDLPDVPTMVEAGMNDFEFDNYTALVAPAKIPEEILARLEKASLEVVRRPEISNRLVQTGSVVTALSGKEHMARVAREVPMYREIIARAGMKKL